MEWRKGRGREGDEKRGVVWERGRGIWCLRGDEGRRKENE